MTIASDARNLLRDFPKYFEQVFTAPMQSTLHLSHPLVSNLRIVNRATRAAITDSGSYAVDVRNGLVRLNAEDLDAAYPSGVVVGGYFYEWFLPEDLEFHARFVAQEHIHEIAPAQVERLIGEAGLRIVTVETRYLFSPIWQRKLPYGMLKALTAVETRLPDRWLLRTFWACTRDA